jgi:hypothetical protein
MRGAPRAAVRPDPGSGHVGGSGTSPEPLPPRLGNYYFPFLLFFLLFLATRVTPFPTGQVNEMLTSERQRIIDRHQLSNTL